MNPVTFTKRTCLHRALSIMVAVASGVQIAAASDDGKPQIAPTSGASKPAPIESTPPGQAQPIAAPVSSSKSAVITDPFKLFCKSVYFSAKRGARWLQSVQRQDGLFVYGWVPSLNRPLPGDNYLRQAGAAAALARAAAVTGDEELQLAAKQAIVVLVTSYTEIDADHPDRRRPTIWPAEANPIGMSGLLLLAISELPQPGELLVDQGEQLARFIASRQREDGSLNIGTSLTDDGEDPPDGVNYFPGEALYAMMRSYANKAEPWKIDVVKRSFDYYRRYFKENPSTAFVPWQSAAFAEALLLTNDFRYAEFVFEMNDWLTKLQYVDRSKADVSWIGGFGSYQYGHVLRTTPGATTGSYAESLVEACRVAKAVNDHKRLRHYSRSAELALRFLMDNQYSIAAYPHFEHWFSKKLNGAFYGSVDDGTVRIDFTQHAVNAMFHFLSHVAEYEQNQVEQKRVGSDTLKAN